MIALHDEHPDVIILGLQNTFAIQPAIDGFTLLEALRIDPVLKKIPVIAYTGGDINPEQYKRFADLTKAIMDRGLIPERDLLIDLADTIKSVVF